MALGHFAHSKDHLVPLIDRLNKYPIGLVDNEILRNILLLLFAEKEAYVASKLPLHEAILIEIAQRTPFVIDAIRTEFRKIFQNGY